MYISDEKALDLIKQKLSELNDESVYNKNWYAILDELNELINTYNYNHPHKNIPVTLERLWNTNKYKLVGAY